MGDLRFVALMSLVVSIAGQPLGCGQSQGASDDESPEEADAKSGGAGGGGSEAGVAADAQPRNNGSDASAPQPSSMPQLVNGGGGALARPHALLITFDGDDARPALEAFVAKLGGSSYWTAGLSEYGVAPLATRVVHAAQQDLAGADNDSTQAFLQKHATEGGLLGAPDPSTIYVFAYPPGPVVSINFPSWSRPMVGCVDFGGYHWEATVGGTTVPFAVIPRCYAFPPPPLPTLVGPDFLTVAISHEVAEAATDPFPQSHPGYLASRDTGTARALALGPENGDFCAMVSSFNPPDIGSLVTRLWSNASASAGHDPCVPAPRRPYFSVTSDMPDTFDAPDPWDLTKTGKIIQTKGVKLAVGASKTIDLHLFSDAPIKDWDVSAEEQSLTPALGFSFDRTRGNDGATLRLTITLNGALPDSGVTMFVVHSKQGNVTNDWYGLVGK